MFRSTLILTVLVLAVGAGSGLVHPVYGQAPVVDEDAMARFEQGLAHFKAGDYQEARQAFRDVHTVPLHTYTTAAYLMEAKSLLRLGFFDDAAAIAQRLIDTHPQSIYAEDAKLIERQASRGETVRRAAEAPTRQLGILLPLGQDHIAYTQSLFTGIRIAVDEHNRAHPDRPVKMVFRDSGADPVVAAAAAQELKQLGVDVVIGPLFSDVAQAVASALKDDSLLVVPPMANDPALTLGHAHTLQVNPSAQSTGRHIARLIVRNRESLRMQRFVTIYDSTDAESRALARGFEDEIRRGGLVVEKSVALPSMGDWFQLDSLVTRDDFLFTDAIFMPITGSNGLRRMEVAMRSLHRIAPDGVRILGNDIYGEAPYHQLFTRFLVTYVVPYYVDTRSAPAQAFSTAYRNINQSEPSRLSFVGYDVASWLASSLADTTSMPLVDRLQQEAPYRGLGLTLDFQRGNVNQGVHYFWYRLTEPEQIPY